MQYFTIRSRPTSVIHCNVICSCIYSATPLQTQCTAFFGNTLFFWTHCIASDYIIIQPPALQSKVEPYQWFIALLWLGPGEFILTSVTPQKPGAGVMMIRIVMMTNGMMMTSRGKYIDPPLDGSDPSKSPSISDEESPLSILVTKFKLSQWNIYWNIFHTDDGNPPQWFPIIIL